MMTFVSVNWWAVIVAAVFAFILGALWFSPLLFAKPWLALTPGASKRTKKQVNDWMPMAFGTCAVTNLIMAYVLAVIMRYTGAHTMTAGIVVALWVGLGIVAVGSLQNSMFSWKPLKLLLIEEGYAVVMLAMMGGIIGSM